MALNGIDIASWQDDLNLGNLKDTDFVIVKATGGKGYSNPSLQKHMMQGFGSGLLMGCYHFAYESERGNAVEEARHFMSKFKPYIGKAVPFLDWEADALNLPVSWARDWLEYVEKESGTLPGIYMSKSVCSSQDWSSCKKYPLWVAQYGSSEETGWQSSPWTDGNGYGAWKKPTLFQYSENGRVRGYSGNLDVNLFYGSRADWEAWQGGKSTPAAKVELSCAEVAARIHADMCDDDRNGYSWSPRWGGDGTGTKTLTIDGKKYTYQLGSYDCSSSVVKAWQLAIQYTKYAGKLDGATYTGNIESVFVGSGLFDVWDVNSTSAERGDLYLNTASHVAMCQDGGNDGVYGYDALSEFSMSESGDVYNNKTGDQTQREAYIHAFYSYPWDKTIHYNGKADSSQGAVKGGTDSGKSNVPENPTAEPPKVKFRVKTVNGWLDEGKEGDGSKITGIAIDFGGNGWYQAKTKKHGWLEKATGYDVSDDENGYAGYEDSPIVAVRAYYDTPNPSETGYFMAKYRVSDVGADWWPWQYDTDEDNDQDGYAGDNVPIDRFQLKIVR